MLKGHQVESQDRSLHSMDLLQGDFSAPRVNEYCYVITIMTFDERYFVSDLQ